MIPTDAELLLLQQDSYAAMPQGEVHDIGPDRVVLTRLPGCVVVTVRGTANPAGWWSDFQIAPKVSRACPRLGVCEDGFLTGAEAIYAIIGPLLGTVPAVPIVLQGHSRGAPIAAILAGYMILDGIPPTRVVCWEKPWGNGPVLRDIIHRSGIGGIEYWHGDDPVPLVPAESWLVMSNFQIKHFGHWTVNPFDSHGIAGIVADFPAAIVVAA